MILFVLVTHKNIVRGKRCEDYNSTIVSLDYIGRFIPNIAGLLSNLIKMAGIEVDVLTTVNKNKYNINKMYADYFLLIQI